MADFFNLKIMTQNKATKICVSSTNETLDSEIDPRFGRCEYFMIINIDDGKILNIKSIKNVGTEQDRGAGISAAEQIGKLGVKVLITGDVGPKANDILEQLGIEVYKKSGVARAAVSEYLSNGIVESDKNISPANLRIKKNNKKTKNQKIFIPLMNDNEENSEISLHFGHAPYFGLYDVSTGKLTITENKLDHSNPNKSPVDQIIEQINPTIVFAQDMGARAINLFTEKNILLKTGLYKTVKEVINNIDELSDLIKNCDH